MISYNNKEISYEGCPACAYAMHDFELRCKMVYEDESFTISQDWELPIPGFMVVAPKRCVELYSELSLDEKRQMFNLVDKMLDILREINVCERFDVLFEEKEHRHFHVWIVPRYKWMENIAGNITQNLGKIFTYAQENFRTEDIYIKIDEISDLVRSRF